QAPPGEPAQHAEAKEHPDSQPEEDRGERSAPTRAAALQDVPDVGRPEPDHGARRGKSAGHAEDDAPHHLTLPEISPAVPDRLEHRWRGDLVGRPAAQLL